MNRKQRNRREKKPENYEYGENGKQFPVYMHCIVIFKPTQQQQQEKRNHFKINGEI